MKISIILPIYNESGSIPELYLRLSKIREQEINYKFEFVFVNDGSNDKSLDLLLHLSDVDENVKVIDFSRNFGQQAAFTAGYDFASGDAVITMDSDLQDPPELIPEMLLKWKQGHKIVYARRSSRVDSYAKQITANLYYRLLENSSEMKIPRNVGDFRLIDKDVLVELKKCREKFRYLRGMVAWLGFKYDFIDFERPNRKCGQTAYTWKKMTKLAWDGFTGFSMFPLKIAAYVGTFVIATSFILFLLGLYDYFFRQISHPLYKWLIDVIYCFMGVQFLLVWLLGEYIGRIHNQVKDRPIYVVNNKKNF